MQDLMTMYAKENENYFSMARNEIEYLFPSKVGRILEIGCGNGATLAYLKSKNLVEYTVGIDINQNLLNSATRNGVDEVRLADPFSLNIDSGERKFDVILLLDVLEHMIDPWGYLQKVKEQLEPMGRIIISVPNVQNIRVIIPLMFGRWEYRDSGILDKTHLRFFTKRSFKILISEAGLNVLSIGQTADHHHFVRLVNRLTFGIFQRYFVKQFLFECGLKP